MLKRPTPTPMHWMAAIVFAIGLSASIGYAAWAAQPAQPDTATSGNAAGLYAIDVRMDVDGKSRTFLLREYAGHTFGIRSDEPGLPVWEADLVAKPVDGHPDQVLVGGRLRADGRTVAEPALVTTLGSTATIQVSTPDGRSIITLQLNLTRMGATTIQPAVSGGAPARASDEPASVGRDAGIAVANEDGRAETPPVETLAVAKDRLPAPHYPEEAARQYIGGKVVLRVTVDADGSVADVQVEESTPAGVFDAPAIEAARQWKFEPATRNGSPVGGQVLVPITFEATPAQSDGGNG